MRTCEREPDYYAVLEVTPTTSPEVVRAAYLVLVRRHHPDLAPEHLRESCTRTTQELNAAKDVLCDPEARAEYDWRRVTEPEDRCPDVPAAEWVPPVVPVEQVPVPQETVVSSHWLRRFRPESRLLRYAGYGLLVWMVAWCVLAAAWLLLSRLAGA